MEWLLYQTVLIHATYVSGIKDLGKYMLYKRSDTGTYYASCQINKFFLTKWNLQGMIWLNLVKLYCTQKTVIA